ncbi:hypothetical protein [Arthrobacter globiformis]|uniref:hypothetical protein n=1 Tax=Arthrobacter globiformis TaxID=1665 RepID=UPI00279352DD|nr:hypothetical protein [Arthrobacter globiformis]MDQ0620243.1 hypothetical protein [Arthrobacter globiformis]
MNPAGRASDPSAPPLCRLIAARPVAAFLVVAIALTWLVLILSIAAVPFALLHLPLAFADKGSGATAWPDVIVALLHASFNASDQTKLAAVFDGAWQQIAAATLLLVVLALLRKFRTLKAEAGHGAAVAG